MSQRRERRYPEWQPSTITPTTQYLGPSGHVGPIQPDPAQFDLEQGYSQNATLPSNQRHATQQLPSQEIPRHSQNVDGITDSHNAQREARAVVAPRRSEKPKNKRRYGRRRTMSDNVADTINETINEHKERSKLRQHFVAASGEFIGTVMFLFFAYAWHQTAANTAIAFGPDRAPDSQTIMFISIAYGFSLLVNAWVFYRISGGLFNPAVTLGMCMTGSLPIVRGLFLFPCQILGGIVAAALVSCMFPGDIATVQTLLGGGTSIAQGVFIEMFLTALLLITIFMLAAEKSKVTFIAPFGIGLALFVAELAGVYYTGGSLNPARSFGPAVVTRSFPTYHWIYWVGPGLGAAVAAGYYRFVKWLDYEEANPDQDSAGGNFRERAVQYLQAVT